MATKLTKMGHLMFARSDGPFLFYAARRSEARRGGPFLPFSRPFPASIR
jgi:hypothetical protein